MIVVNFKTYAKSSGENSLRLARIVAEASEKKDIPIIACPQYTDINSVKKILPDTTWSQHIDAKEKGRATGWFPVETAQDVGVSGTLLNHSEHKLSAGELGETINKCREINLTTLVFADSLEEARAVSLLSPDYIGYEPPELIASKDTSVAQAKPEAIRDVVNELPNSKIIVGAGIKSREDVRVSLDLGAVGVALASSFVKAKDPRKKLIELLGGF